MAKKRVKKVSKVRGKNCGFGISMKDFSCWDMKLVKLSTAAFMLFLLTIWPWLANALLGIHWGWYLVLTIIFAWRPMMRAWK